MCVEDEEEGKKGESISLHIYISTMQFTMTYIKIMFQKGYFFVVCF